MDEEELQRMCRRFGTTSVKIIRPITGDYAYVNFISHDAASEALRYFDQKRCTGEWNITAKWHRSSTHLMSLSSEIGPSRNKPSSFQLQVEQPSQYIKVLIHGHRVITPDDLTALFIRYGQLSFPPRIIKGNPDYAYINYTDSKSAIAASQNPTLHFNKMLLSVKLQSISIPVVKKDSTYFKDEDPLVNSLLTTQPVHCKAVEEFGRQHDLAIFFTDENLLVYGNESKLSSAKLFYNSLTKQVKKSLVTKNTYLPFYNLPHLVDLKMVEDIEKKHSVEFSIVNNKGQSMKMPEVSSKLSLITSCEPKRNDNLDITPHDQSLSLSFFDYKWSFENDQGGFSVFDPKSSKSIERLYQFWEHNRSPLEQLSTTYGPIAIGMWSYNYNFQKMEQTNIRTTKRRKIKHEIPTSAHDTQYTIQCRGLDYGISAAIDDLKQSLSMTSISQDLPLDRSLVPNEVVTLIEHGTQYLVDVRVDESVSPTKVTVTGYKGYAERISLFLTTVLFSMRVPDALECPLEWQRQSSIVELFPVQHGTPEFKAVAGKFQDTMGGTMIVSIQRIQNKWLWKKYSQHRKMIEEKNNGIANEMELFHGTRGNDPKMIYDSEEGFDMRFSAQGMWGQANYFAANASYSNSYAFIMNAFNKQMFLVKVLTGNSYPCFPDNTLRLPPLINQASQNSHCAGNEVQQLSQVRYDSVTGTTGGSQVFMTYDNLKAYPAYLITYFSYSIK